jgi:enoyl-CoA hydratase/carnithine racemase
VVRVADDDHLLDAALGEQLLANSPFGIQMTKRSWSQLEVGSLAASIDLEPHAAARQHHRHMVEAMQAFLGSVPRFRDQ